MSYAIMMMLILVFAGGLVGGIVNALMTDNGFVFPKATSTADGARIVRPGFLGNMLIGGIAATISWGLYGPLSAFTIYGTDGAITASARSANSGLSLASLVGAVLVGIGGARWLSNEVDKNLLRAAAVDAAGKRANGEASKHIALSTPADALNFVKGM